MSGRTTSPIFSQAVSEVLSLLAHAPQGPSGLASNTPSYKADEKAEEILHVQEIVNLSTPHLKYFSEAKLQSIAGKLGIEESVILGVLQHKGLVEYRKLNKFKRTVSDLLPKKVIKG